MSIPTLLLIYTIGSLTDYWTTAWGIAHGGVEQNPLGAYLIAEHGIASLLYFVLMEVAIVAACVWLLLKKGKVIAGWWEDERTYEGIRWATFGSLWMMTLIQWLIVAHNLKQIA